MAVTQNLARLSDAMISECTTSTATLDDVCSFRGLKSSEYLDLDWAPTLLKQAAVIADVHTELLEALDRAARGEGEVNAAYPRRAGHYLGASCLVPSIDPGR